MKEPKSFLLGVQWHPEWRHWENPVSKAMFAAFGDAVREHAKRRGAAR
jgi:putative glutamine amidotransferase